MHWLPWALFLLLIWNCVNRRKDLFWPLQSPECRELLSHTECLTRGGRGPADQAGRAGVATRGQSRRQGSSASWAVLLAATSDSQDGPTSRAAPNPPGGGRARPALPADRAVARCLGESVGQNRTLCWVLTFPAKIITPSGR